MTSYNGSVRIDLKNRAAVFPIDLLATFSISDSRVDVVRTGQQPEGGARKLDRAGPRMDIYPIVADIIRELTLNLAILGVIKDLKDDVFDCFACFEFESCSYRVSGSGARSLLAFAVRKAQVCYSNSSRHFTACGSYRHRFIDA